MAVMTISETINGVDFVRRVSSVGVKLRREDGQLYDEVYDLPSSKHTYEETDMAADIEPTKYSVRKVIAELKSIGRFAAFRQMLETANCDWDFVGANYLASNDADFITMMTAVVANGILTQAELDELLPKCVWEQTPMA